MWSSRRDSKYNKAPVGNFPFQQKFWQENEFSSYQTATDILHRGVGLETGVTPLQLWATWPPSLNTFHPNISMYILYTVLSTVPEEQGEFVWQSRA